MMDGWCSLLPHSSHLVCHTVPHPWPHLASVSCGCGFAPASRVRVAGRSPVSNYSMMYQQPQPIPGMPVKPPLVPPSPGQVIVSYSTTIPEVRSALQLCRPSSEIFKLPKSSNLCVSWCLPPCLYPGRLLQVRIVSGKAF